MRLPDGNGVEVCREIRSRMPEVHCLMLTSYGDDDALFEAIMAGAAGYVLKQIRGNELVSAVRKVAGGRIAARSGGHRPGARSACAARSRPTSGSPPLTVQERRILDLIALGYTNRQIANEILLAEKTVKNYVSNLLTKLGMERRTEAAVFAARLSVAKDHGS